MRAALASLLAVALVAPGRAAYACVACGTGDPTTAAFSDDDGLRVLVTLRSRDERLGHVGVDGVHARDLRAELGFAWRIDSVVGLELALPMIVRDVRYANDGHDLLMASGDIAVRARVALDLGLAISAGVSLPTAPVLSRHGEHLPIEAQPGTGSVDPSLGLAWSSELGDWTPLLSLWATVPLGSANPSLRMTASLGLVVYRDASVELSLRPALEGRRDGRAWEDGAVVESSGGFILFGGGDVELSLDDIWRFTLGARAPLVEALRGEHHEGLFGALSVSYDVR